MSEPTRQTEAQIYGGRLVRPGDKVALLPADLMAKKEHGENEEEKKYFAKRHLDESRSFLGEGPFIISWIGEWPCGRVMLYLKGADDAESGAYATDFM